MRFPPIILCAVLWLISAAAFGQGAVYQVTPIVPGAMPRYGIRMAALATAASPRAARCSAVWASC